MQNCSNNVIAIGGFFKLHTFYCFPFSVNYGDVMQLKLTIVELNQELSAKTKVNFFLEIFDRMLLKNETLFVDLEGAIQNRTSLKISRTSLATFNSILPSMLKITCPSQFRFR